MYTTCPECRTRRRLAARELRDGRGRVRCEACLADYDALERLEDDARAQPIALVAPEPHHEDRPAARETAVAVPDRVHDIDEPAFAESAEVPYELEQDVRGLVRQPAHTGGIVRACGLFLAALALLAALGLQYTWFHASDVARAYPAAAAYVERFCAASDCAGAATRDPAAFRIIARSVRVHPLHADALELTAAFAHGAPRPQGYPYIEFTLFDVAGYVTARRVFAPSEYLTVPPSAALPRDEVVHVSLDLVAPDEAPLSFEIRFL